MAAPSRFQRAVPFVIVAVGLGWLLSALHVFPQVNWVWILALGITGVLVFVVSGGVDKVSILIGPFFIAASLLSTARQAGLLSIDVEVPLLVMLVGGLLFVSQRPDIPVPRWYEPPPPARPTDAAG
jgi:hypothetical protein